MVQMLVRDIICLKTQAYLLCLAQLGFRFSQRRNLISVLALSFCMLIMCTNKLLQRGILMLELCHKVMLLLSMFLQGDCLRLQRANDAFHAPASPR